MTLSILPATQSAPVPRIAARIRDIGVERVLYGSDAPASPLSYPAAGWAAFQKLPLTTDEFRIIANTIAPYMKTP